MTSLALRLREDLRKSTVNTVLDYLGIPDNPADVPKQKKIQALVKNVLTGYWPKTVVYLPLPGKPDPCLPINPLKPRPRVLQQGQKGNTCLYYALKRIRVQVGKKPTEQFKHFRMIEKRASKWRKGVTQIDKECGWKLRLAQINSPDYGLVTKKNISAILERVDTLFKREVVEQARSLFKEFSQSNCDTLSHFVEANYYRKLYKVHQSYLSLHNVSLESVYNSNSRVEFYKWEDLCLNGKISRLSNYAFRITYETYGLKLSSWHPTNPIEELGKQIEAHGPHVILGNFGKPFYEEGFFQTTRKIEGRCVYGWLPNAKRLLDEGKVLHGIVLIGVDCDKKHVFFIDPANPSDPKQPLQEEIYVVSYENLRKNISPLNSIEITHLGIRELLVDYPYAIHGDPELARL